MVYEDLANKYLKVMSSIHSRSNQKKIDEYFQGENFVLYYIFQYNGNLTPSNISNAMNTTSARIANILNNLEKKGFICRVIDTEDRRKIIINLTDTGKKYVQEQNKKRVNFIINMFKYLGEDDARAYIRIMKKLAQQNPKEFM